MVEDLFLGIARGNLRIPNRLTCPPVLIWSLLPAWP